VRISGSNAGYTAFRGGVKSTGYPLQSPLHFPSRASPCAITLQLDSTAVLTHKYDHLAESRILSALFLFSIFSITEWLWKQVHINNYLMNWYQVGLYCSWPWPLTGHRNFLTLRHISTKMTLLTTQQVGVPRNSVCRTCKGFLYTRNVIRFYPTRADMIFHTPIKVRPSLHRLMELINTQRCYVRITHAEFHRNRTINLEIRIGNHIFIRPVRQLMPLSLTFGCDIQSKVSFLNSCVKVSLPSLRRSNQVVYLFHDDIFTLKTTN
jgi:hypothetical protein